MPNGAVHDCEDGRTFNRTMTGNVNVRLVIVRGPDGTSAAVSALDMVRMRSITIAGTRFLSALASVNDPVPRLNWTVRTSIVDISLPPRTNPSPDPSSAISREPLEGDWRDAALTQLVGATGATGMEALRQDTLGNADNAVTVLFTAYDTQWIAYALASQAKIVLSWPLFERPGQPPRGTNISLQSAGAVVAHELCHLFGAPDEYAASGCGALRGDPPRCGFGNQDFPNFNCENTGGPKASCLMRDHTELLMCAHTRVHIGWI